MTTTLGVIRTKVIAKYDPNEKFWKSGLPAIAQSTAWANGTRDFSADTSLTIKVDNSDPIIITFPAEGKTEAEAAVIINAAIDAVFGGENELCYVESRKVCVKSRRKGAEASVQIIEENTVLAGDFNTPCTEEGSGAGDFDDAIFDAMLEYGVKNPLKKETTQTTQNFVQFYDLPSQYQKLREIFYFKEGVTNEWNPPLVEFEIASVTQYMIKHKPAGGRVLKLRYNKKYEASDLTEEDIRILMIYIGYLFFLNQEAKSIGKTQPVTQAGKSYPSKSAFYLNLWDESFPLTVGGVYYTKDEREEPIERAIKVQDSTFPF